MKRLDFATPNCTLLHSYYFTSNCSKKDMIHIISKVSPGSIAVGSIRKETNSVYFNKAGQEIVKNNN